MKHIIRKSKTKLTNLPLKLTNFKFFKYWSDTGKSNSKII